MFHRKRLLWGDQPKRVVLLSNYVQDITVSRTITFESLLKGKLQFEDFIKRIGIWKHNDTKGMSEESGIPESTVKDLKNEESPVYKTLEYDVREIKSRKPKKGMKFLVSTDVLDLDNPEEIEQKLKNIGYKFLS